MLTARDIDIIRSGLEEALSFENALSDRLEITFYYITRTASGADVARHYDNSPLDPWDEDSGFVETTNEIIMPCTFVPRVEDELNLVQEGYHPDSEIEISITARDLEGADISVADMRNVFEYASMVYPHEVDMKGRTSESITRLWDILTVRPRTISKQLINVIIGLALREQDTTKVGIGDI